MSGLSWISYNSNGSLDAGYNSPTQLYNNSVTFFTSPPAQIANGLLSTLQLNSGSFGDDNPPFSTFSLGPTDNIAIKFSGYFCPNKSGTWTIYLGPGITTPCDDFGILFLGEPNTTITPDVTYSSDSNVPSSTLPFIRNIYNSPSNSKSVTVQAGKTYPILIYYNQGRYGYNFGLGFSFNGGSLITDFSAIVNTTNTPSPPEPITCFKEDTKILTDKGYVPVQDLRKGDLVKTLLHNYVAIVMIGKKEIYHPATKARIKDQLYKCSNNKYPEIFEDLIITGCHSILVDEFSSEKERERSIEVNTDIFLTDNNYRLPACVDERASVYETEGTYNIYHFALEHDDYYMNYGVYANGLLVETCSKRYVKEVANMTLIE